MLSSSSWNSKSVVSSALTSRCSSTNLIWSIKWERRNVRLIYSLSRTTLYSNHSLRRSISWLICKKTSCRARTKCLNSNVLN